MIKSIKKEDVQKLIVATEASLKRIEDRSNNIENRYCHSEALGMAEATIEHLLKQLKGDYPIV